MDWTLAIDRNRAALLRVLAVLFTALGLTRGGTAVMISRHVRRAVLRVLRPAESAARRLIVIAARSLSVAPRPTRPAPVLSPEAKQHRGNARLAAFPLFDPRKRFVRRPAPRSVFAEPRLSVPGIDDPVFTDTPAVSLEDFVSADRLCRRLQTLRNALDTLPRQARRFARWRARSRQGSPGRVWPFRPGWPPGHRIKPVHEIDLVLRDCHALALYALEPQDTS